MATYPADSSAQPDGESTHSWDSHYRARHPTTQPRVNQQLAAAAGLLPPGVALDLGCGDGGDSLWLAERGWRVTAVDISTIALERVAASASALGLSDRVVTERHDVSRSLPSGSFDLVCASYFHTPFAIPRNRVLRTAAQTLLPGGRLLVIDHGSIAPWSWNQDSRHFPTPHEVAAGLDLDPAEWSIERADMPHRQATGPGGTTAEVVDHVLMVHRADDRIDLAAGFAHQAAGHGSIHPHHAEDQR